MCFSLLSLSFYICSEAQNYMHMYAYLAISLLSIFLKIVVSKILLHGFVLVKREMSFLEILLQEDDEHTIEADEALITEEERREELEALQNESELPLEELLNRYSAGSC